MRKPIEKGRSISALRDAFATCEKPTRADLAPWGGLDGGYVVKNWAKVSRAGVSKRFLSSYHAEDLSYMSSVALRYFLPEVLVLCLSRPDRVDFGGFISVVSRLEGLFASGRDEYRPVAFKAKQRAALAAWCEAVLSNLGSFELGSFEQEYRDRVLSLATAISKARRVKDYDRDYFVGKGTKKEAEE